MSKCFMFASLTVDDIYPVGSIYMSVNDVDPANLFGGTWERIKERFLLGAGDTHKAGTTGGEFEHTLTVNQMPKHFHSIAKGQQVTSAGAPQMTTYQAYQEEPSIEPGKYWTADTLTTGENQPHNTTPPYLAIYIWKRTA